MTAAGVPEPATAEQPSTAAESEEYLPYSMILEWEPHDRIYIVTVPELPGCCTHGETLAEAVKQGRDAYESWIDVARELGRPVPAPKYFDLGGPNPPGWGY